MKQTIGILGGIGPEASAEFYKRLIENSQKSIKSNVDYPHIILESIPAPELFLDNFDLKMYNEAIINLEKSGADFIVMVCNTAHLFLEEFQKLVKIPIIDLRKEVGEELINKNVSEIIILGSSKTSERLFDFSKIKKITPSTQDLQKINRIIINYNSGNDKDKQKEELLEIIKKYQPKNILIACTEISVMLKETNMNKIDTMDILVKATLKKWNCQ